MILVCVRPFGNFDVGDEVEVPAGSVFDTYHFEHKAEADSTSKEDTE